MAASRKLRHSDLKELDDFPEVRELIEPHVVSPSTLAAIATALVTRREEAKAARQAAGLEAVWLDAEEQYVGIDDANRAEWNEAKWTKPSSMDGPLTKEVGQRSNEARSTAFMRLTARYTDTGAHKLSEILLPPDDKVFAFEPMPEPDLIKAKENQSQVVFEHLNNEKGTRPARAHEALKLAQGNVIPFPTGQTPLASLPAALRNSSAMQGYMPQAAATPAPAPTMGEVVAGKTPTGAEAETAPKVPLTVADVAEEQIELLRKSAKAAEKQVEDWLKDCFAPAYRKVIATSAKLGVGVLKGPFPKADKVIMARKSGAGFSIEIEEKIKPAAKWVNPWNFFPDPACGENIHDGDYVFERDYLTEKQLRDLKKLPGYIESAIDLAISQGPAGTPSDSSSSTTDKDKAKDKARWPVWYYYGTLKRADLMAVGEASGAEAASRLIPKDTPKDRDLFYVIVTLVNDCVVKAAINPLNSGSFPYHVLPWQWRSGSWAGVGIPEQCRTPQRSLNAAVRSMMNNAGISSGPQVIIDKDVVTPADGQNWTLTPNKLWLAKQGTASNPNGVKGAFTIFEIPNTTQQLMELVNYFTQMFEECTSIPLVTQGKQDDNSPETLGATVLLNTNANQMIRAIGYASDELVIEPFARQCFEWLLLDPEVPDDSKGQFRIEAQGSRFVERAISDQAINGMAEMVLNPAYGYDPIRYGKLKARSARIHPDDICYSPEELSRIHSMPPGDAPAVAAAKIRADAQVKSNTATTQVKLSEIHTNAVVDLHELALKERLAMLEYANRNQITLTETKAELAGTAMKLSTEERLNAQNNAVEIHKHHVPGAPKPAVQAPGRARDGHAADQS